MGFFSESLYTPQYQIKGDELAVFSINKGRMRVALDGQGAPIHMANFYELASSGFYDGLKFHRYGSRATAGFCRLPVLFFSWATTRARQRLYGVRSDRCRSGCHCFTSCGGYY